MHYDYLVKYWICYVQVESVRFCKVQIDSERFCKLQFDYKIKVQYLIVMSMVKNRQATPAVFVKTDLVRSWSW